MGVRGARVVVLATQIAQRRRAPRRAAASSAHRRGRLELGRAEAEVRGEPGAAARARAGGGSSSKPQPQCLRASLGSLPSVSRDLRPPGILARGPWQRRPGARRAGATSPSSRAPERSAPRPTPRSPRCATAARRRHDGLAARLAGFERRRRRAAARPAAAALGAAAGRRRRVGARSPRCASCATPTGRWLAGPPRAWLASLGRALGARRRRRGRGRRGPGGDAHARARGGVVGRARARAASRRSCCLPHRLVMLVGQAWLPPGAEVTPDARARRARLVAGRRRRLAGRGRRARCGAMADAARAVTSPFTPAQVPLVRPLGDLRCAARRLARPGLHGAKLVFGWAHGIGWIVMSLLCIAAVRRRVIPLWLARRGRRDRRRRAVRRQRRVRLANGAQRRQERAAATRYSLSQHMAVNTTVQVTMPAMGESVTEGTVLEWHKQEGDTVDADETLVEISTDKVDAEVPAPAAGTVVKIHAAEGDTVDVGAVLAEIAPTNGARARPPTRRTRPPPPRRRRRAPSGAGRDASTSSCPQMGESVTEGTILEWAKSRRRRGRGRRDDRRDLHRQGRRRAARARRRHDHRDPRRGRRDRHRRPGHRPHDRRRRRRRRPRRAGAGADRRAAPRRRRRRAADARRRRRSRPSPRRVAAAEGVDLDARHRHRPRRAHHQGRRARRASNGAHGRAAPPPDGAAQLHQGRRGDARPLHGRVAARSRPRPRSARSPSRRWTAAASSSRRPARRSPSPT